MKSRKTLICEAYEASKSINIPVKKESFMFGKNHKSILQNIINDMRKQFPAKDLNELELNKSEFNILFAAANAYLKQQF